jgi:hypothetical protein
MRTKKKKIWTKEKSNEGGNRNEEKARKIKSRK